MPNTSRSIESSHPVVRPDRRTVRREATKEEILTAAWELVRELGLAGLAMRDLGERVGMKAQSIYSYYSSKHEIYDAMFLQGYVELVAEFEALADPVGATPLDTARAYGHEFFRFCTSDPVRYQLLFQRTIPDFVPSDESFAVAVAAYESMMKVLTDLGITDPADIDLWTAVLTGLTDQQISNDPGGERWECLIDRAIDMTLREICPQLFESGR